MGDAAIGKSDKNDEKPPDSTQPDSKVLVRVAWIGVLGLIIAALIQRPEVLGCDGGPCDRREPAGRISSPGTGDPVSRRFMAEGTLSCIPRESHVWLAVQRGNELWPKEPEISSEDRHWTQEFYEGGVQRGGKFTLVLLRVDEAVHRDIEEWLVVGHERGSFGSFERIPAVKLAVVRDVVLR